MASNGAIDLDIAMIGNLRTLPKDPPKYGTYVTANGQRFNIFTRDLQLAPWDKQYLNLLQAHQLRRSCASVRCSRQKTKKYTTTKSHPCISAVVGSMHEERTGPCAAGVTEKEWIERCTRRVRWQRTLRTASLPENPLKYRK
jgi:hypothetical protein